MMVINEHEDNENDEDGNGETED